MWTDLENRVVDRVGNGYRLRVVEDLNGWVGDKVWVVILDAFEMLGENANGRRTFDFCWLCSCDTYYKQKSLFT